MKAKHIILLILAVLAFLAFNVEQAPTSLYGGF